MSSPTPDAPAAAPAPAGGIKQHLPLIVALVAGLVVGGASGAFAVGPALAKGIAPAGAPAPKRAVRHADEADAEHGDEAAADDEEAAADEEEGASSGGHDASKPGEMPAYTLDNLVLNPAESGGTRFLLLTVTFELRTPKIADDMKARDAELRDAVLVTIGKKTVDQLADMTQREALKAELTVAATKLFKKRSVRRVYFPQFVIQ